MLTLLVVVGVRVTGSMLLLGLDNAFNSQIMVLLVGYWLDIWSLGGDMRLRIEPSFTRMVVERSWVYT